MADPGYALAVFLHLAAASRLRRRPHARDRFLLLAGAVAAEMDLAPIAARCRQEVLAHNPRHLVRRWPTLRAALADGEFVCLLRQLRRRYPQEKAEQLLQSLEIDAAGPRQAYFSDAEYAAALLGIDAGPPEDGEKLS